MDYSAQALYSGYPQYSPGGALSASAPVSQAPAADAIPPLPTEPAPPGEAPPPAPPAGAPSRSQVATAEQHAPTPMPQVYNNGAQYQQYQADAWAAYYQQQQQHAAAWHQYGETTSIALTWTSAASLLHCHCPRLAVKILPAGCMRGLEL